MPFIHSFQLHLRQPFYKPFPVMVSEQVQAFIAGNYIAPIGFLESWASDYICPVTLFPAKVTISQFHTLFRPPSSLQIDTINLFATSATSPADIFFAGKQSVTMLSCFCHTFAFMPAMPPEPTPQFHLFISILILLFQNISPHLP
jgi:hypothetical protein